MVLDKLITRHCFICNRRGDIVKKENLSEIKESKILEKMKVVFQNEIEKIKLIPQLGSIYCKKHSFRFKKTDINNNFDDNSSQSFETNSTTIDENYSIEYETNETIFDSPINKDHVNEKTKINTANLNYLIVIYQKHIALIHFVLYAKLHQVSFVF